MQQRDLFRDTFCQGFFQKGRDPPPSQNAARRRLAPPTTYYISHTTYHILHTTYTQYRYWTAHCWRCATSQTRAVRRSVKVTSTLRWRAARCTRGGLALKTQKQTSPQARHGTWVGTCRQQALLRGEDAEQDAKGDSQEKCPQGCGAGGTEGKHRAAEPPRCARPAGSPGSTGSAW